MAKKIDYASLFTLRADGRYMGYWHDAAGRHAIYDRDPERLYNRIAEKELPEDQRPVLFRASAEKWETKYRETVEERTWANFRPHYADMVAQWGDIPTAQITADMIISDLERAKAKDYSRTVVNSRKVIITGILNSALADGVIPFNPALSVRLPKGLKKGKRSAPSNDVVAAVCNNIDKPFGFYVFLLLCTGLRKSEALALHKSDVDFKAKPPRININRSLTYVDGANPREKLPKSGRTRWVPIISILAAPLKKHMDSVEGDLLFPKPASQRGGPGGGYYSERAYEGAWDKYCAEVGLVDENGKHTLTAHPLRHATAKLLHSSGVDVYTAQQILGHANVSTTMEIYAELDKEQQTVSVKKYDKKLQKLSKSLSKSSIITDNT